MKSVLLHIQQDDGLEARMQAALDLVRASGGHLTCLQVTPIQVYVAGDGFAGGYVFASTLEAVEKQDEALRNRLVERLAGEDVAWDYAAVTADPVQSLVRHSRLADVIVMSQLPRKGMSGMSATLTGDVLMAARVPVLAVPPSLQCIDFAGPAVVAWNGSFEAAHALKMAVPLLARASAVHLVAVDEHEGADFRGSDASEYLSRHGIRSELHLVRKEESAAGPSLTSMAQTLGAAYLVMGAYGHSRAREWLFGGVTRSMLADADLPLLLAH